MYQVYYINENINSEIEIRKEIYKNSLWNKYNNKNDDSWINYKGNAVTNKYNRFKCQIVKLSATKLFF
ncbi:hypothetical protein [Spiroplasma endosymbiont of Tipula paludosa]|uniref:hypothetical protein n=2 Tax=Spiroplasma endosymbiont of Tipula paludosa TaxID=3066295 RepID=UPI0035C8EDB3